jgi:quercetin dioxygenase-like cupin family protein
MDERQQPPDDVTVVDFALGGQLASGRSARTLLKKGGLRVTLVVLAPGGALAEHVAPGPITVQPLTGRISFRAAGREHPIEPGQLLAVAAGVPHAVHSVDGGSFLLTLARPD